MPDPSTPISPDDLAAFHRVLEAAAQLDDGDPQSIEVQRAVGHMFKLLKRERRKSARAKVKAADRDVLERTATGNAERIDDETAGILLTTPTAGDSAGELLRPQGCYICKQPYTRIDAFYHQLCPDCAAFSHAKRDATTDLTGRRALLTGGRAKIGMYIALRLLRDGADLTITTRFPTDAARRFAELADSAEWLDRLHIVGIDLRDPSQVSALADAVAARGPLDIIINNAAQTVRRSPARTRPSSTPSPATCRPSSRAGSSGSAAPAPRTQPRSRRRSTGTPAASPATSRPWIRRRSPRSHCAADRRPRPASRTAPPSTPAASSRTSCTPTPGCRPSRRSSPWNCSRCSCATPWRRSSSSRSCGPRWPPRPRAASTW
ncbi:hypothetical protein MTP03_23980 [Tsukamurella sp. PLM1]|nr:hypothetical protein MTP03_23980 [Tsukamurella sp. PLM1]